MKHCYGYIRVSTVKQGEGVSLNAQKDAIIDYASRKGLMISQWWEEKETAAKRGRPIFDRMVAQLKRGKAAGLLIHKIDRSARNYHDWAVISDLADAGVEIHIATESFDFSTYGGRMAADFTAVVAANYVRNLKQEIRKGQLGQLKIGLMPWGAPIGYCNNGAAKVKTPDPMTAPLAKLVFELYASGTYSIRSLAIAMTERGLRSRSGSKLSKASIEIMLGNPFYCGLIHIKRTGQTYKGAHEPIISAALFQQVQDIKSGKTVKKDTRHNHLYRGLFRCMHCSRSLIGELHKGRVYYRCQTKGCITKSVREDQIDGVIVNLLRGLSLSDGDLKAALERLPAILTPVVTEDTIKGIELQASKVEQRLDCLIDMMIDNLIEPDSYQTKKQSLMIEQRRLAELQAEVTKNAANPTAVQKFLELATNLAVLYQSAAKAQKRRIVEWATLNRLASGKSAYFAPSKWLIDTQNMLGVLQCAEGRDNSRILEKGIIDSLNHLEPLKSANDDSLEPPIADAA
jgi:site-specific DNA recombinase